METRAASPLAFAVRFLTRRAVLVGLGALLGGGVLSSASADELARPLPPDVAAEVNGRPIPRHIVEVFTRNDQEALGLTGPGARKSPAEVRAAVLGELTDRELVSQGVEALGLAPDAARLDALAEKERMLYGGVGLYEEHVRKNGFTGPEYREVVLRAAANGEALTSALSKEIKISDEEVKAYYEAHRQEAPYQWAARVTAVHILINAQPGVLSSQLAYDTDLKPGTDAMREAIVKETNRRGKLAEEVRRKALAPGANFGALAAEYSDDFGTREHGGMLGMFAHGTHPPALDDVLFKLADGEVGPVVRTDFGFHVVKTLDHKPAATRTLEEADAMVRPQLFRRKQIERLRSWLEDARARARVIYAPDLAPADPTRS